MKCRQDPSQCFYCIVGYERQRLSLCRVRVDVLIPKRQDSEDEEEKVDETEQISQEPENGARLTELGDGAGRGGALEGGKAGSNTATVRYASNHLLFMSSIRVPYPRLSVDASG